MRLIFIGSLLLHFPLRSFSAKVFRQIQSTRIIDGVQTDQLRYPYMASLTRNRKHTCGGSLIAPDIVITAAHCSQSFGEVQIGRHNITNSSEAYESLIVEKIVTHPSYYRNRFLDVDPHDFAIVKLFGKSSSTPIRINRNGSLLERNANLQVIGWGSTNPDDLNDRSDVLRETSVQYIPNNECQQVVGSFNGFERRYEGLVVDVTLCAMNFEDLTDSCKGDSGGPLFVRTNSVPEKDIIVGITSAGYGCANPTLPAFYARISEVHPWIDEMVCELSDAPPDDFPCSSSLGLPPKPVIDCDVSNAKSTIRTNSSLLDRCPPTEALMTIDIEFLLDEKPDERGWILEFPNQRGVLVSQEGREIFSYAGHDAFSTVVETIEVPNNRKYILTLLDSGGDGNLPSDNEYSLTIRNEAGVAILSVAEVQPFSYSATYEVTVGHIPTNEPTQPGSPSVSAEPTFSPTLQRPYLTVVINFDEYPENAGFRLEFMVGSEYELLHRVYPGTFAQDLAGDQTIETAYLLSPGPEPHKYRFTMTANEGFGFLPGGSYHVWMGPNDAGSLLFEGSDFYHEDVHTFQVEPFFSLPPFEPLSPPTLPPVEIPSIYPSDAIQMSSARSPSLWSTAVLVHVFLAVLQLVL